MAQKYGETQRTVRSEHPNKTTQPTTKNNKKPTLEPHYQRSSSYGGYFHLDYPGLKKRVVFGMSGYGGQTILIDVENSRIVVINSSHYNHTKYKYNHKKLILNPIKKGK